MAAVMAGPAVAHMAAQPASAAMSKARKRKQDDHDTEDKPRGRPRKNSKDESAAERRRTQIRLAQRAYRQRKETTIDELRQRVNELTGTLETIDRSIRDFTTSVQRRGVPPQIANELNALVQQLGMQLAAARESPPARDGDAGQQHSVAAGAVAQDARMQYTQPRVSQPRVQRIHSGAFDNMMDMEQQDLHSMASHRQQGFVVDEEPVEEKYNPSALAQQQPNIMQITPPFTPSQQNYQSAPHAQQRPQNQSQAQRLSPPQHRQQYTQQQIFNAGQQRTQVSMLDTGLYQQTIMNPRTVTPINGLTDYEKSFSRKLQRICIESGYQLLIDPSKAPTAFSHVFKLLFSTNADRADLAARFAVHIKRDINSTLDSDSCPFSFIGGAGLHYPDSSGLRRPVTGRAEDRVALDVMASSIPGLGGEWLDANDVQGYLHELGVRVDGSAGYVHACVPVGMLATPAAHADAEAFLAQVSRYHNFEDVEAFHARFVRDEDSRDAPMGPVPASSYSALPQLWQPTTGVELGSLSDLMDTSAPHFFSIPGTASYFPDPAAAVAESISSSADGSQTFSPPLDKADSVSSQEDEVKPATATGLPRERVTVTIDVCKLLKVLLLSSVCLGRAPGFRRWHVQAAVRASVLTNI